MANLGEVEKIIEIEPVEWPSETPAPVESAPAEPAKEPVPA
jgi:hypothetical protein